MVSDAYMPRPGVLTDAQINEIARVCSECGYSFRVALRTAQRDGEPFYIKP